MSNLSRGQVKVIDDDTGISEFTVDNNLQTINMGQLVPEVYDYISITYVPGGADGEGEIQTVTYKDGGVGGTTVATLLLVYNGDDKLVTITRL